MKTIYSNRKKLMEADAIVDIKEYHSKYSLNKRNNSYSMAPGTPFVINVEGAYVLLSKVATIDKKNSWLIGQFITELRHPTKDRTPFICFKWER